LVIIPILVGVNFTSILPNQLIEVPAEPPTVLASNEGKTSDRRKT